MRKRFFWMAVATPLLALVVHAQQLPSSMPGGGGEDGYGPQLPTAANCSDPTQATSPQCMGTSGSPMMPGSMAGSAAAGAETRASQPGNVPTYNDTTGQRRLQRRAAASPPRRPELLTEFQKLIVASTAQLLPIYGENLFQNAPSTFTPLENIPVPSSYVLGPGDELRLRVWGQVNFNANLRVDRAGDIFVPQIGAIHVAGLSISDVQPHIHDAIARVYRHFELLVDVGQIRSIEVYVTGEARRPGVYTVSALSSMIDTLFASGGPSVQGTMRDIELRRNGQVVTTLDLYQFLIHGDKSHDTRLQPGDVIFIPAVRREAAVMGSVRHPAIYELLPGETLEQAIADAGGLTETASQVRVSLERNAAGGRQAAEIKLDTSGMSTALRDGDVLNVLAMVSRYEKTVTLRGNTANPGRFAWHEGMRLSDLIPDREALITRDYWWKRVQMGLPGQEFQPMPMLSSLRQPTEPADMRNLRTTANRNQGENSATAEGKPEFSSDDAYQQFGGSGEPVSGNAGATSAQAAAVAAKEQHSAQTGSSQATLAEEEQDTRSSQGPRTEIRLTIPEIDWSYAVIERMDPITLKTKLIPFDLGKLVIDHDSSQDFELQPGDIVTIFSQADIHVPIDEQTKLIHLEGEFVHAGTYSARPGETLRDVVRRAGGLTPNAYLYGSVLTRESTRVQQQRRIDESVHEMTLQMQRGNLALAASPATTPQDLAGMSAAQSSERQLIDELQQIRANGRIVLQFKPNSTGLDSIPNLKLEDGDTFTIPSVPSTVNVVGAVFNQNSFVYQPGEDVRSFLDLAGGPNSNADRKQMFVIRANGAVLSRTVVKSAWDDAFLHLKMYPGDSIIVPEKSIKPSLLRGLIDWSQVFSQFAFGAAAINVLR